MSKSPYAQPMGQAVRKAARSEYQVRVDFLIPKDVHNMMRDFARAHEVPGGMQEALRLLLVEGLMAVKRGEQAPK